MKVLFAAFLLLALALRCARAEPTGRALPGLEPYDEFMTDLIGSGTSRAEPRGRAQ
jgi:hypothetical protein